MSLIHEGQSISLAECRRLGLRHQVTDPTRHSSLEVVAAIGTSVLNNEQGITQPNTFHATIIGVERVTTLVLTAPIVPLVRRALDIIGISTDSVTTIQS